MNNTNLRRREMPNMRLRGTRTRTGRLYELQIISLPIAHIGASSGILEST
jgi:hypothetical protein